MRLRRPLLAIGLMAAAAVVEAAGQQPASSSAYRIVVVEGEDAVNIIQQKTAVRPLIEIRDANNLPVAGVPVTFSVAGPGASFAGGVQSITVVTNAAGQAAAAGLTPTAVGAVQIQATAAIQGQTAIATITQTNVLTAAQAAAGASAAAGAGAVGAGAGVSTGVVAGIIGGGAAAVGGTVVATRGRTSSDTGARPTSTTPPATTVVEDRPPTTTTPPATDPRPPTTTPTPRPDEVTCSFTVDPKMIRPGSSGGTERVTVTYTPRDCATRRWIVTNVPTFVQATPHEGDGDGVVTLTIAAHTGTFERTDAISIAGNVIAIVQPPRPSTAGACMPELRRGSDLGELRTFELGAVDGTVSFTFNPGPRNENRIVVSYEGRPLFDTGCALPTNARTVWLPYAGRSSSMAVQVMPNCAGSQGSTWEYQLSCPLPR